MQLDNIKLLAKHETMPPMRYKFTHFLFNNSPQNALLFGQDRSWKFANLLYHVLRGDYYFQSSYKNHFIAAKNYISDILPSTCAFPGTPPCADMMVSFWVMQVKTQDI